MYRNRDKMAGRRFKIMMTSLNIKKFKSCSAQGCYNIFAGNPRKARHIETSTSPKNNFASLSGIGLP